MNVTAFAKWTGTLLFSLALGACGGSDDGGTGTQSTGTVIGAAGGTVIGPNGASVVIPPGALATNTAITITQTSAGSPPLPGGFSSFGQMFAFTPHGTTFAVPVTLTVPFDPAAVPAGITPALFKTNAQNQWQRVANSTVNASTVSAQVTSFSHGTSGVERDLLQGFERTWELSNTKTHETNKGNDAGFLDVTNVPVSPPAGCAFDPNGGMFGDCSFGQNLFDPHGNHEMTLEVFSSTDGVTFWASADDVGSSHLHQRQCFFKRAANATLEFVITKGRLEGADFIQSRPDSCPKDIRELRIAPQPKDCSHMFSVISFETTAINEDGSMLLGANGKAALDAGGYATLYGRAGLWEFHADRYLNHAKGIWTEANFALILDAPAQIFPLAQLGGDIVLNVDLSALGVDARFCVDTHIRASAESARPGSEQWIGAFLRDPARTGGTVVNMAGLELSKAPLPPPPTCTNGPNPASGVLQFSSPTYAIGEQPLAGLNGIVVTRTQGSTGAVRATVTAGGGTAASGVHYWPLSTTVHFADGDTEPRTVPLEIIGNSEEEPDKTVNLSLSAPGNCVALGAQSSAVVTIIDDDNTQPSVTFTIGGTVTGLVGTGLVLQNLGGDDLSPGNGTFTFAIPTPNGVPYAVTVAAQPANPSQVCTVTNGSGTVNNANITNVAVNCVTPPPSGGLDLGFGSAGKVSTAFGGDDTAMALQADGKIVMVGGSGTDFLLARYNVDGSLDAGFGTGGLVTRDVGAGSSDEARAVAIQADGKIVVAGNAVVGRTSNNQFNFDFALARFNTDGSPDLSFGNGGKVTTDFNGQTDRAFAVAIQGDGKIVVAGSATPASGISTDFAVARYDSTGASDGSFGSGGKLTTDIGGGIDIAQNIVVQPNGAILVSGVLALGSSSALGHAGLARYDAIGNPDNSFGTAGKLTLPNLALGEALALQADGRIVIAGSAPIGGRSAFAVMRLGGNGAIELGFGSSGLATAAFSIEDDFARAVLVQADGRIVVVGQSSNRINPNFAVARFGTNGALDASFGTGGKLTIDFFGSFDGAENVAVQPDGKIVVGGFATNGTRTGYGLVRVLP